MKLLHTFVVGLASLVAALSVTALIWVVTLSATVLQRDVVKAWLSDSGVYNNLVSAVVEAQDVPENTLITPAVTNEALDKAFSPGYVQQQTESVLDKAYDWVEGKMPSFGFSISIADQRQAFEEQLALAVQPEVAKLPLCSTRAQISAQDGSCRPAGVSVEAFARTVATEAAQRSNILARPITEQTLAQANPSAESDGKILQQLPALAKLAQLALWALPLLIAVCVGVIALVANNRLHAFRQLGRRICLSAVFMLGGAAVLAYFAGGGTLPMFDTPSNPLTEALAPLFSKALGSIALYVMLLSGTAVLIGAGIWITCAILEGKRERAIAAPTPPHQPSTKPPADPPHSKTPVA